ncbi:ABC transporter permease [Paraoerskovia sediminicola]|uniref:ABC transporter permease n=1 Tax=Paraoerskovia sediminicola TaxID=1138587 RepID=A0ABM8G1A6_9CELL|nr:hypothetical protein [Paraoerskovia sediminicola]BDZ41861.1 ABC transporter permease [Paraoerskovia sediminicola]
MSATTTSGYPTADTTGWALTFGHAVRGEWIKIRTMRITPWLALAFLAITVGMGASSSAGADPAVVTQEDLATRLAAGLFVAQAVLAVLAALSATSEWATGLVRVSLTAVPRRSLFVTAKAVVVVGISVVLTIVGLVGAWAFSLVRYSGSGTTMDLADPLYLWLFLGGPVFMALISTMGLGFGVLMRSAGAAVTTVVALAPVLPVILAAFSVDVIVTIRELLPASAGPALMGQQPLGGSSLPVAVSILVIVLWGVVPPLAGVLSLRRRDA